VGITGLIKNEGKDYLYTDVKHLQENGGVGVLFFSLLLSS
jgi:hypothetical protein